MPLFSRSSEKKPRSHHRFSFRRHSQEATEPAPPPAASSAPQTSRFPVPQTPRKAVEHPQPQLKQLPRQPGANGSSITSEAATSVSSSLRSSGSLSFLDRKSAGVTSGVSGSGGSAATAAETSSSSESESEAADTLQLPIHEGGGVSTRSISSSSSVASSQSMRNSLADYRQLRCSMTYKNRIGGVGVVGGTGPTDPTFRNTSSITSASSSDGRLSDMRMTGMSDLRMTGMSARISETSRSSRVSESRERLSTSLSSSPQQQRVSMAEDNSSSSNSSQQRSSQQRSSESSAAAEPESSSQSPRATEMRMTEANVAAMQTRRALQQMVLAMDEEDEDDSEDESESEFIRRSSSAESFRHNVLQVSADDYRKFQFRLRQLEDLCADQARKQASIDETIEREVRSRTRKVVDAMEKNIAMYRQAKELECEREIQKRVSELEQQNGTGSSRGSVRSSTFRESSVGRLSSTRESEKGKPLEKLFHPRRARRRLEMMKEREEQQKREMEQFREFIRSAEMSSAVTESAKASSAALKELGDPQITEALMGSSQEELVEMICVLRKHVGVQEAQLGEAKALISAAIEAREEAEATAHEAVELTMLLDSRLMRASQEIVFIRDELRESQLYSSQSRSMSPNDHSMLSLPRTSSFLHGDSGRGRRYSNYNMPFTPSSSC